MCRARTEPVEERVVRLFIIALAALGLSTASAGAAEQFVPDGHTYAPGNEQLPPLNSPQDLRNGQADIYQSEIYRHQLERAIHEAEMRRLESHEMQGGTAFTPRY